MGRILLFCATVFLSAFLLFQVQPVIGKTILPWFGSSPGVWTTCLLFFQVLLLGGYTYAHFVVSRLAPKRQALVHASLLAIALLALPITPAEGLKPEGGEAPIVRILLVLGASVGLPYLVLSSTGPLLQGWFARLHPGRSPYRLYALSNVGSLLALLGYPFWVERNLALRAQAVTWSLGFGAFALFAGACAWALARGRVAGAPRRVDALEAPPEAAEEQPEPPPRWSDALLWFALSACGSALLLATTNQMCLDVAVMPFLWVVPLAIYLLSFILTFDHERWYVRPVFLALLPIVLLRAYRLFGQGVDASIERQIVGYSVALFVACMCLHGELSRAKPSPRHLTFFFLIVSLGGAAGGLLVAVGAPSLFEDFYELPLLLAVCFAIVVVGAFRNLLRRPPLQAGFTWDGCLRCVALAGAAAVALWTAVEALDPSTWMPEDASTGLVQRAEGWFGGITAWIAVPIVLPFVTGEVRRIMARKGFVAWWADVRRNAAVAGGILACIALLGFVAACGWVLRGTLKKQIARGRNFYGALQIKEFNANGIWRDWTLRHGRIMHGFQYKQRPGWPTSYYGPRTGVGLAVQTHPQRWTEGRPFRIGIVGLGAGTMAAYANARVDPDASDPAYYVAKRASTPGDVVCFYEINPMVRDWAEEHFSYLGDARARGADARVLLGDARLVMEQQIARGEPQAFDVLAIDAFSSDAIPIHLLTRESFDVYFRHLAPDGVLAVHVTNRFIDLLPIVRRLADELGKQAIHVENEDDDEWGVDGSDWVLVTTNEALLAELAAWGQAPAEAGPLWTDDFSSVYDVLKRDEYDSVLDLLLEDD